jgi:O-antigen/teichoic acid export membrane protein
MVLRHIARDSAIYGGTDFASKLIAFLAFPLIAAALSPLAFGALELMLTATALLGMMANCGLNNALQRFYWDTQTDAAQRPVLVSSGLAALSLLLLAALVLGGLALLGYTHWMQEESSPLGWTGLLAGLVLMAAGQLVQYLLDITRLHMAPWRFAGIALVSRVMTAVAGVATVVWLGWGLDGLVAAQALVMAAAVPLALYAVRTDLTWRVDPIAARKLMQFGHPFIYAGLAFWLFGSMDRWLLASMSSVEEVGVYSVAHRFASVILFVSIAFGQAWSPLAIKIRADHPQNYRTLYVDILLTLLCAMSLLGGGVALFSPELMAWLMPVEYQGAALALSALALGLILQSTMQVTAIGISIENKTHLFARLSWMAAALNLVLNLIMVPAIGALGAAVATSLSYLFLTGAYLYYTQRLHPLPLPWNKILLLVVLWLVMAGCLVSRWSGHHLATSVGWRSSLMFVSLLVCASLIPWRRVFHAEH